MDLLGYITYANGVDVATLILMVAFCGVAFPAVAVMVKERIRASKAKEYVVIPSDNWYRQHRPAYRVVREKGDRYES